MFLQSYFTTNNENTFWTSIRSLLLKVTTVFIPAIVSGLLISVLTACGSGSTPEQEVIITPSKYVGIWKSQGSGLIVELDESNADVYEITDTSCLQVFNGTQDQLKQALVESLTVDANGKLVAPLLSANETILLDRISMKPTLCNNGGTSFTADPETNFEVLWSTFEEHYSYFEQRNIDWQQSYDSFRNRITTNTTELELIEVFAEMLAPFKDAHIAVEGPNYSFDGTDPDVFNDYFGRASDPRAIDIIQNIYLSGSFKTDVESLVYWGDLNDNYGYINFRKFGGFAGNSQIATEHDTKFDEIIAEIMADFKDKTAIIIDVRNNSGGGDGRVQRLASIFTDTEVLMYSEQTRHEGSYTSSIDFLSTPRTELYYAGKVVILTSPISVSSAEQLAINVMPLAQATIIGEPTYGALSQLSRTLPNGWSLKLTNQRVIAADGNDYEVNGVPPHLFSKSFSLGDLEAGIDSTLNVTIEYLDNN